MADLKSQTINGVKCEIRVGDDGELTCMVAGEWLKADTLKALVNDLKRVTKKMKVEVAVPAMLIGVEKRKMEGWREKFVGYTCMPITLIGIDWRKNQLKYRTADGEVKIEGRTGFSLRDKGYIGKVMTDEEVAEWVRLRKERDAADEAFRKFDE